MHNILSDNILFRQCPLEEIRSLLDEAGAETIQYGKDDIVALKGGQCKGVMLLMEGEVRCEVSAGSNHAALIDRMSPPALIMPLLIYAPENRFPVSVVAATPATIIFIPRERFTSVMQKNIILLQNFLSVISDTNKPLSDKMFYMGLKTMKGKFARLLLDQAEQEKSLNFRLRTTQREMAELFGVTRPALARAIGEMSAEGAIYADRKQITILYPEKLRQYLKE